MHLLGIYLAPGDIVSCIIAAVDGMTISGKIMGGVGRCSTVSS
jgi:hypothetical protein